MTHYATIARTPAAPAPSLADLMARAVRVGREVAALAHDCGAGTSIAELRRINERLAPLAERRPLEIEDDALAAVQGALARDLAREAAGTERRVVDRDHDDGREYPIFAEVEVYTERGGRLLDLQAKLREVAALRDRIHDRLAAERALRELAMHGEDLAHL